MMAQPLHDAREPLALLSAAPEVLDAENALLGILLAEPGLVGEVARALDTFDFVGAEFDQSPNARIFAQLVHDAAGQITSAPHVLAVQLASALQDVGGGTYLGDLIAHAPPSSSLPQIVGQLATSAAQRRIMRALARPGLSAAELGAVLEAEGRKADDLTARVRPIRATPFKWVEPSAIPPRAWLYDKHFIRKFLSATFAAGGVGKTMLLMVEAVAMATGRPLLGATVREPLKVWLINLEDPLEELQRRLAAVCLQYGIRRDEVAGRLYVDSGRDMDLLIAKQSPRAGVEICVPCVRQIERECSSRGIDALICDPFVACHEVEENSNPAIQSVSKQWAGIADRASCSIDLVHHVTKAGSAPGDTTVEHGRGAGALLAAVRSARVLNAMTPQQATEWGLEEPRQYFSVGNGKSNLAPPSSRAKWRKLEDVDLENGPSGFSDRVGVPVLWEPPSSLDDVSVDDLREVQKRVQAGSYKASEQAADWVGYMIADVLGWNLDTPRDKARVKSALRTWLASGALKTERRMDPKKREPKPYITVGNWVSA